MDFLTPITKCRNELTLATLLNQLSISLLFNQWNVYDKIYLHKRFIRIWISDA